jgi:hypothetical protein
MTAIEAKDPTQTCRSCGVYAPEDGDERGLALGFECEDCGKWFCTKCH